MDVVGSWVGGSETENMNWSENNGKYPSSMERFTTETVVALSKPEKGSVENGSLSSMNLNQVNSMTPPIRILYHTFGPLFYNGSVFPFLYACSALLYEEGSLWGFLPVSQSAAMFHFLFGLIHP